MSLEERKKMQRKEHGSEVISQIRVMWEAIKDNPDEWLQDLNGNINFVAGGGLPLVFGDMNSEIYQALDRALEENGESVDIAGVNFKRSELEALGAFYRFLSSRGYSLHCIDERLEDDLDNVEVQVHEHCGACAATHAVVEEHLTSGRHVEDILLTDLGQEAAGKQQVYDSMPHHVSLTVFIDFNGDDAVADPSKRAELQEQDALAFQVSLQVDRIREFLSQGNAKLKNVLLDSLVKWNVQIARNIIGGGHNDLRDHANETIFVLDKRGVDADDLVFALMNRIKKVQHAEEIVIE